MNQISIRRLASAGVAAVMALSIAGCSSAGEPTSNVTVTADPEPAVAEIDTMSSLVSAWEDSTGKTCGRDRRKVVHAAEAMDCSTSAVLTTYVSALDQSKRLVETDAFNKELGNQARWLVGDNWAINDSDMDYEAFIEVHGGEVVRLG